MIGFIYKQPTYRVVLPLVVAKHVSGEDFYVYQHGLLPQGTNPLQIAELLRSGAIQPIEETP